MLYILGAIYLFLSLSAILLNIFFVIPFWFGISESGALGWPEPSMANLPLVIFVLYTPVAYTVFILISYFGIGFGSEKIKKASRLLLKISTLIFFILFIVVLYFLFSVWVIILFWLFYLIPNIFLSLKNN